MKLLLAEGNRNNARGIRDLVRQLSPSIQVASVTNPFAAMQSLRANRYDGWLLDIGDAELSYFDLLKELGPDSPPFVLFSDFPQFALEAFEFGAADYLVHPVTPERLDLALSRLESQRGSRPQTPSPLKEKNIVLRDGENLWMLDPKEISCIQALQNYCKVYFRKEHVLIRRPLKHLEEKLSPCGFFRISRDCLLNVSQIEQCTVTIARTLHVRLITGMEFDMSRRQTQLFRQLFSL